LITLTNNSATHNKDADMQTISPVNPSRDAKQGNGLAIASFVLGVIALLLGWIFVGTPFAVVGIVLGGIGVSRSRRTGKGLVFSILGIVLSVMSLMSAAYVAFIAKKVYDSKVPADPRTYSLVQSSCSINDGTLTAAGEITNIAKSGQNFLVIMDVGSESASTAVTVNPGETGVWELTSTSSTAQCGKLSVQKYSLAVP
jgi:hypothetical protein